MTKLSKVEPQEIALAETVSPMVAMIERVAMSPDIPIEKLERMLDMKERLDAQEQKKAFNKAMADAQSEMPEISKNKENKQTSSKYADLAAIYKAAKPVTAKHGFSFSTFPAESTKPGFQGINWTLRHRDGHTVEDFAEVPIDNKGMKGTVNKTVTHAFGSTVSYGRRYLFCMIFDIATEDDGDGNPTPQQVQFINDEQYRTLRDLIEETGTDEANFHLAYGHKDPEIATLQEFPQRLFEKAKKQLERKKAEQNG